MNVLSLDYRGGSSKAGFANSRPSRLDRRVTSWKHAEFIHELVCIRR